ncbi:MAG TPA: hypothetical protein VMV27_03660 [Candidatus Binataceae bacterium]|nr:hypothetical protein [Candidatus Binataceae bacterium]
MALPTPAPNPESNLIDPSGTTPIGPSGTPITADSEDACVAGQGEPPDVAADVSPTQIVEIINSGIWISDKAGNLAAGFPESPGTFWAANSPPSGDFLSDTQVAWDPFAQRWLASTLAMPTTLDNGDLYIAFSKSSDATAGWNFYKLANVCSSTQNGQWPVPDQPVIGYNQTWAAIDLQCRGVKGIGSGSDQLVLIADSVLTQSPAPTTLTATVLTPPAFGSRPSRDISAGAGLNLFLAASSVPSSSSLPYVEVYQIDDYGGLSVVGNSPGNGVPGEYGGFPSAQHDSCGAGSACAVNLQDARITNVVLQKGSDGNNYLLTSFHAGGVGTGTVQALWFVLRNPTYRTPFTAWNEFYVGGPGWWAGYPTITMDNALGIAFTFQSFYYGSNIYPNWYVAKGFASSGSTGNGGSGGPPLLGYGILSNAYRGPYAGCASLTPTRWGDYMSTVWDPNLPAPAAGNGFWTAQEYSNGGGAQTGSNQSTQITALADPLPNYVSNSQNESECGGGNGSACVLKLTTPSGLQNGDVVLAFLDMGGNFPKPPAPPPDKTWTELPIANQSAATSMLVGSCATHDLSTIYAYAHIYGSSTESGTYKFSHPIYYLCNNPSAYPELEGALFAYRGADPTAADYLVDGYASAQQTGTVTVGPAPSSSPSEGTLINVFDAGGSEGGEYYEGCGSLSGLTGSPIANWETLVAGSNIGLACYEIADLGIPTAGTAINQYSANTTASQFHTFGWQVLLPPK